MLLKNKYLIRLLIGILSATLSYLGLYVSLSE